MVNSKSCIMHSYGDKNAFLQWEAREIQYFLQEIFSLVCPPANAALSMTRNACMRQYCVKRWRAYQRIKRLERFKMHWVGQLGFFFLPIFWEGRLKGSCFLKCRRCRQSGKSTVRVLGDLWNHSRSVWFSVGASNDRIYGRPTCGLRTWALIGKMHHLQISCSEVTLCQHLL